MTALGRGYRAYARAHPELFRLVFGSAEIDFSPDDVALGHSKGGFGLLVATAQRGVETGEFVALPPEMLAMHCWASVHGFVMLELSGMLAAGHPDCGSNGVPPEAFDELFEQSLRLVGSGTVIR
jgi:hypothetical protein